MNFRTTLFLAIALVVVAGIVWLVGSKGPAETAPPKPPTELLETTALIGEDFGRVVKLTCEPAGQQQWQFVRDEDDEMDRSQWRMVAPLTAKASGWQVDGIVRKLTQLKYQVKYTSGAAGAVTTEQAGLDPPASIVAIENEDGKTATIEIGKDASATETYVRVAGSPDIYLVSPGLSELLKDKAIEYRDQLLFDFEAEHVKKLGITTRPEDSVEPVTYALVRSDSGWTFEAPFKAPAVKAKIDGVANSLSSLRATAWVEADVPNLDMYGLGQAATTIRATIEEPAEKEEAEEETEGEDAEEEEAESEEEADEPEPEPEPVIREIVVHLSRQSPIGEQTKVYLRPGDERSVATITKSIADRLIPNMSEWRDMRVTAADASTADRIELTTPLGSASFKKQGARWVDAETGEFVDAAAVRELLKKIEDLEAVNFIDAEGEQEEFGFDVPQAVLRLNVPGQPEPVRITVGQPTDPQTKRLVYARRDGAASVAKVRAADVGALIRGPAAYRERTIFELKPEQIEQVVITRPDELTGEPFTFTLGKVDDKLQITEPAGLSTAADQVQKLTKALADLKAVNVLPDKEPATFGLDAPAFVCRFTYQPPTITRYVQVPPEESEAAEDPTQEDQGETSSEADEEAETAEPEEQEKEEAESKPKLKAEKYTPPAEDYTLKLNEQGNRVLAMRGDRQTIYEVNRNLLNLLKAAYHDPAIFDFQESQVTSVLVAEAAGPLHQFARVDDQWQYAAEPDLPIDPKKVMDLLLRIKDLKTQRYLAYGVSDLAEYGLDAPWKTVKLASEGGEEQGLIVSETVCEEDPEKRHYAALLDSDDVFLLPETEIERFEIDLSEFED
jgi:hypothetical protein